MMKVSINNFDKDSLRTINPELDRYSLARYKKQCVYIGKILVVPMVTILNAAIILLHVGIVNRSQGW